jgi:hypothetical protein
MQRGIFALQFVLEGKIHRVRLTGLSMTKRRLRFPRIVVAVVKKENDRATDFRLEFSRGGELRIEKAAWKKTARLLAETNDR